LSQGKQIWLVYGTPLRKRVVLSRRVRGPGRRPAQLPLPAYPEPRPGELDGLRGYVQDHVARIVEERAPSRLPPIAPTTDPTLLASELHFDIYAYICGLNNMVSGVRDLLHPASAGTASKSSSSATTEGCPLGVAGTGLAAGSVLQGLKARRDFEAFLARLKSCPVTKQGLRSMFDPCTCPLYPLTEASLHDSSFLGQPNPGARTHAC